MISPRPATRKPREKIISPRTASPARNLALITASRVTGCPNSRLRVPRVLSPLIPSKPRARPTRGPRKATKETKEGRESPRW